MGRSWEFMVAGRVRIALLTTIGAAVLAASGLVGMSSGAAVVSAPAAHPQVKHEGAKITLRHTAHGKVLVGANGHSLYTFSSDTRNHSNCNKACRKQWPPVTAIGTPHAGTGVSARHLKVIKGHQVTYYGHPLYTYFKDTKAGQTKGETLFKFGGYWYLSSAKGALV
jgi:predicted lipoprotein with Yx(FWY)xxD motif